MNLCVWVLANLLFWVHFFVLVKRNLLIFKVYRSMKPKQTRNCYFNRISNNKKKCTHFIAKENFQKNMHICPGECKFLSGEIDGLNFIEITLLSLGFPWISIYASILTGISGIYSLVRLIGEIS